MESTQHEHNPNISTLTVHPDGTAYYLDVTCSICGRSGSIGILKLTTDNKVTLLDNDGTWTTFAPVEWD